MKLNVEAMEKLIDGEFGNFKELVAVIPALQRMLNKTNGDQIDVTTSWHTEEKDLIPEIIIRVRKPTKE